MDGERYKGREVWREGEREAETETETETDSRGRMCEMFHQLLAVDRWFPPGTPVSSTRKLIS